MGRVIRLIAAVAALTFVGMSGASAGWYGNDYGYSSYGFGGGYGGGCCGPQAIPVNWGCGSSCAPAPVVSYSNCCAPAGWGCGNSCGFGNGYGGYGYSQPITVTYQGPSYDPPFVRYTDPAYQEPYVAPYRSYRPYVRPYARPFYRPYWRPRVASYRYGYGGGYRGYRHVAPYRRAPLYLK